eukprot:COSAG02_NODE_1503_length_12252_cov_7.167133_4_plen_113_part_00
MPYALTIRGLRTLALQQRRNLGTLPYYITSITSTPTGLAAASVGERWMHRRGFRPSPAAPAGPRHLAGCARMRRNRFYLQRDAGAGCAGGSVPEALCAFKRSCDTAAMAVVA